MDYTPMLWGSGMPIPWHQQNVGPQCIQMNSGIDENSAKTSIQPVYTLSDHTNDVTTIEFAGRNLLATGSSDKIIRLYKWYPGDTFKEVEHSPLRGHKYAVNCISFSPFSTKLASASTDGQTLIWDVKTGEKLMSLQLSGDSAGVRTCAFSPNSSLLATGGDDDTAAIWDVSTLSLVKSYSGHESSVVCVSFSPDGACLATGAANGDLRLWDALYGHAVPLVTRVEVHDLGITTMHFSLSFGKETGSVASSKEYLLATGGQDTDLHLWTVKVGGDLQTPQHDLSRTLKSSQQGSTPCASVFLKHTLCGHTAPIMTVRFSTKAPMLASASGDKTVRLWDSAKFTPLCVLEGAQRYVTCCAFSEDGALIAAGGGDRVTRIWAVPSDTANVTLPKIPRVALPPQQNTLTSSKSRESKKLVEWNVSEVCEWLRECGLGEYAAAFRANRVDGREALAITPRALQTDLGVEALGHRNKVLRFVHSQSQSPCVDGGLGSPPPEFLCPITHEIMRDPVLCADGFSYERSAVEAWLRGGRRTSPMTNERLDHLTVAPNRTLKNLIHRYIEIS